MKPNQIRVAFGRQQEQSNENQTKSRGGKTSSRFGAETQPNRLANMGEWIIKKRKGEGNLERTATKGEPGARDWRRKHPGALVVDSNMGRVAI
jgi:hypothetical protein